MLKKTVTQIFQKKTLYWVGGTLLASWIGLHLFAQQILVFGLRHDSFPLMELGAQFGANPDKNHWNDCWNYLFHPVGQCGVPLLMEPKYYRYPLLSYTLGGDNDAPGVIWYNNKRMAWLLEHGANPNKPDCSPPLFGAAYNSNLEAVNMLISYGADIRFRTDTGFTILEAAAIASPDTFRYILNLDPSLNIHTISNRGWTLLHTIAKLHDTAPGSFDLLVSLGLDPNALDFEGLTPLDHALETPEVEHAEKLISLGARINKRHLLRLFELAEADYSFENCPLLQELLGWW